VKGLNGVEKEVQVLSGNPPLNMSKFKRTSDLAVTMDNLLYSKRTVSAGGYIWGYFPVL
jgi:hypothetical protein